MIEKTLENAFNVQINKEFYSSYLYLSMNAWLLNKNLFGFANWMKAQVQEENLHGQLLYAYVFERGGNVTLQAIDAPPVDWQSLTHVFEEVLAHEKLVTASINALADVADDLKDRAAVGFLDWFINEQVEEEKNASMIVSRLKLFGEVPQALYMLDQELGARVFTPSTNLPITPA